MCIGINWCSIYKVCVWLSRLFHLFAVGLSRYSSPSSPVCDRKDFFLNFNGISSFHPATASGSYYHQLHHHHQSVCQDVKPCIMWNKRTKTIAILDEHHINYTIYKLYAYTMCPLPSPVQMSGIKYLRWLRQALYLSGRRSVSQPHSGEIKNDWVH